MTDWASADGIKDLLKGASRFGVTELLVLEHLRGADSPVSGQNLAEELSVTRAAIWKHIKSLRAAGYTIEGTPSGGYVLNGLPHLMYAHEIIGDHIFHFQSCGSTNDIAKELAGAGAPDGTVVIADEQSAGKGRRGRSWVSPLGGVYMSVVTRPALALRQVGLVTIAAAVAAVSALEQRQGQVEDAITIKWPNDILLGEKKLGGILCEMAAQPDQVDWIVVGIGLNMGAQSLSELGAIQPRPGSIQVPQEESLNARATFVRDYIAELSRRIGQIGDPELLRDWTELSSTIGRNVESDALSGTAVRLGADGSLVILSNGAEVPVMSGDLVYG